jgi:membrane associated rhomboid family serine protease
MLTSVFLLIDLLLSLVLLLPLKDDRGRYRNFPYMTAGLILSNVTAHVLLHVLLPMWLGDDDTWLNLMRQMMLVPAGVLNGEGLGALSMITAAFMHADWSHLLGNMFFLFFFGRKLEDVLGPAKFGLFYMACVFVSGTGSVLGRAALPLSQGTTPGLGASGAIMGVVAAYLFLYQDQRIRTLPMIFGIIPIPFTLPMPAWVFILYTVVGDLARGWLRQEFETVGLIYSAVDSFGHLGGIIAGLTCLYFFLPRELMNYRHRLDLAR